MKTKVPRGDPAKAHHCCSAHKSSFCYSHAVVYMCTMGLWILFLFFFFTKLVFASFNFSFVLFNFYLFLTVPSLVAVQTFLQLQQAVLLSSVHRLLTAVASLVSEHGRWDTGSVVVVDRLSCSTACGVIPDQGSNPCLLRWQADSLPLSPQGSPHSYFFIIQSHGLKKNTERSK